jgi:hypothetical protein
MGLDMVGFLTRTAGGWDCTGEFIVVGIYDCSVISGELLIQKPRGKRWLGLGNVLLWASFHDCPYEGFWCRGPWSGCCKTITPTWYDNKVVLSFRFLWHRKAENLFYSSGQSLKGGINKDEPTDRYLPMPHQSRSPLRCSQRADLPEPTLISSSFAREQRS